MAFNINAHVILSGPKNIKAVTKKIQSQLGSVSTSINLKIPKNISKQLGAFNKGLTNLNRNMGALQASAATANSHLSGLGKGFNNLNTASKAMSKSQSNVQKSLQNTGKNVAEARNEIQAFGKDAALAIRRFSAFTVATGVVFGFVRALQNATKAAIDYEREITKVVQVTSAGKNAINSLKATIDDLSNSLGVDANELAALSRTFAQTGQSIEQVRASITAVARSSLAPSFGEMKNTAEGLIAALAQFNIAAADSEAVLSSINAVSKKFAVEAEDLVSVIRRAGGVFSQAAGNFDDPKKSLNELIGIFTAVRSTTRESADTIAVGLRTIFTRIQRRGTIDFLKQFNIELQDAQGNFVGLFPAFQKLSAGLGEIIRKGDALTLSAITEELGGVRQVGKLIPAITQFNKALAATKIAGEAAKEGLGQDVALALQPLGKQFEQLQKRFTTLVRTISESKTFQNLAKVALSIGNAFLSVAETLKPLIPLMTTFAAIKISKGLFEFGKGFIGGFSKGGGAAGAGETLGGGITGGAGRDRRVADTGAQQALTAAVKSNTTVMGTNTTALQGVTSALQGMGNTIANTTTQMLGAVGNLINALNRGAALGSIRPKKFAKGGPVRGPSHAQGGVPAILEGGEYVIPKGYAGGGQVLNINPKEIGGFFLGMEGGKGEQAKEVEPQSFTLPTSQLPNISSTASVQPTQKDIVDYLTNQKTKGVKTHRKKLLGTLSKTQKETLKQNGIKLSEIEGGHKKASTGLASILFEEGDLTQGATDILSKIPSFSIGSGPDTTKVELQGHVGIFAPMDRENIENVEKFRSLVYSSVGTGIDSIMTDFSSKLADSGMLDVGSDLNTDEAAAKTVASALTNDSQVKNTISGYIFEGIITALTGAKFSGGGTAFDFEKGEIESNRQKLKTLFKGGDSLDSLIKADAKPSPLQATINNIRDKVAQDIKNKGDFDGVQMLATGGPVFKPRGTDTVPAMLTPGEFVINKGSAEKIGYGNLENINRYAGGGPVRKGGSSMGVPSKKGAQAKQIKKGKKKFVEKSPYMTMQMATTGGGERGGGVDDWMATFFGTANAPDEAARGAEILGMDGYLDFDVDSPEFGLHISNTEPLKIPSLLGKGYGSAAYKKLYDWTQRNGQIGFFSDGMVSTSASKVWEGLKKHYGIPIEKAGNIVEKNLDNKGKKKRLTTTGPTDSIYGVPALGWTSPYFGEGGAVGTDTVPAMLTPGEFVVNKKSAQNIGYGNLGKMNHMSKGGVAAKGNVMQYFAEGSERKTISKLQQESFGVIKVLKEQLTRFLVGGGTAEAHSRASAGGGFVAGIEQERMDADKGILGPFIEMIGKAGESLDVWDKKIQDSAIGATEKLNSVAAAAASAAVGMAGGAAGAAGAAAGAAAGMAGSVGATLVGDASAMLAGFTNLLAGARKSWSDWLPDEPAAGKKDRRLNTGVMHGPELSPTRGKMVTESEAEDALKEASKNTATELDKYIAIMSDSSTSAEQQAKAARNLAEAQQKEAEAAEQLAAAQDQLTPILLAKAAQIAKEEQAVAQTDFDKAKEAFDVETELAGGDDSATRKEKAAATSVGLQNEITAALDQFQAAVMDQQATEEKAGAGVAAGTMTDSDAVVARGYSEAMVEIAQAKLAAAMDAKTNFYMTDEGALIEAGEKLKTARDKATAATAAVGAAGAEAAGGAGGGAGGGTGGGAPGAAMGDLVGGMGSAVAAVSGFTAAFASFDIQNPLMSIATLGMAASQAKDAMNMLGPAVSKFLPGLKQMIGGNSAASQAIDFFGKEIEGVKGAPGKFGNALTGGMKRFGTAMKRGMGPMKAFKFGLSKSKGALLKSFNVNSLKGLLAKGLTGIPGIVTSLIAGPIVGAISGAISSAVFGEKEKIEGTNIEGFKGTGAAGGAAAGALESAGGAASAGLATAAMFGPVVGAIVAGGVLLKGAFVGAAKQVEFNAFKELGKSVKEASGMLDKFNALSTVTPAAMKNLNDSIEKVDKNFDKSFDASFARERTDQAFTVSGMLGKGGVAQEFFGAEDSQAGGAAASALGGVGLGLLATAGAAVLAGTKIGALVGSFIPLPGAATLAGAAIGATVGGLVGLGMAMFSTDKSAEAAGKAFDKAAKQITPEFLENLDKAFQKTASSMMDELAAVDPSLVQDFSDISTENMDLSASGDAAATNTAFEQMNSTLVKTQGALEGAGQGGKQFMSELNRMMALKVKLNLVDAVRTEAEFMDKESGDMMKKAFQGIKNSIDFGSTPEEAAAGFARMKSQIQQMQGVSVNVKTALLDQVNAQQKQNAESLDAAATAKVVEMRMREARQAFDALAAGLDNFSNTTKGIADQLGIFVGNVKQEFDNLFTDTIQMDQVSEFNPFSNIDASSRSQIRGGMEQVRSLGGSAAGKEDPFKGMESLVAESKEIPFAIADALRELSPEAKGGKVDNSRVLVAIEKNLAERGIVDLPPQALAGLKSTISGALSRQGKDATVFSADALEKLLSEQGDVVKNIAALSEQGRAAMETAFEASQAYRNALLNVASLQQQMVEKERDMKLSMLDKEANVRDRINKALGRTPDVMESALSDLGGRLETMTAQVSGEGGMTTGVAGVGNVFDVGQLTKQREDLQTKRDKLRGDLGVKPGQIFDAESVDVSDTAQKEAAQKLGLVNAQLNGNTAALKELANDTRMLAAVEQQVADLQKKAIAAEQAAMGLAQAQIKLASGEISIEEFNKIVKPLNTLTTMGKGQSVPLNDMSNLLTLINNKDPLVAAELEQIISASTKKRQAAGETVVDVVTGERRQIEERDVKKEFVRDLKTEVAVGGAALGDAGAKDKITRNLARSFAAEDAAEKKAASMGDVGDLQANAQKALFDSQKKGFEKIFADANQGLDLAVDKFGDAVDKFRELRGLGVNTEQAAEKVMASKQKVQELKDKQAQAQTPKEKAKIGKELQDAQVELSQSKKNLEAAEAKQKKEVEKGDHDVKLKTSAVTKAEKDLEATKRESQVKSRAATMLPIAAAAGSGEDFMANVAENFKTPEGGKGAVNEERIRGVLGMGTTANAQFNENDTWGYNVGPEFMKETESLFTDFSANIFGEGTQAAADFAKQMEGWRDATAALNEDADHFMGLVEGGLPNALKAAAASDNASAEAVKAAEARLQTAQKEHAEASKKQEVLKESVAEDKAARIEVEKGRVPATPAAQQRGSAAETATDLQQKEKAAAPPTAPARTVGPEEQKVLDRQAGTAATTSLPPALSGMTPEDIEQTKGMTAVDAAKHMEDKRTAQAKPADKAKAKPDFMKTKEENEADLQAGQAEHRARLEAKVKASPIKQLTTEDMKSIKKAKEPLNVDAAETQQKDVQTTLNAFRATAMQSADADIRKGAGSLFMESKDEEKVDPAKAALEKLASGGEMSAEALEKFAKTLAEVQIKLASGEMSTAEFKDIARAAQAAAGGDETRLPVGVAAPAVAGVAGQETLATTPPEQALAATGQIPPTTERDRQQGPAQGSQAPGARHPLQVDGRGAGAMFGGEQIGEALSKGAVELNAALVNSAPEMAIGFVEGVKGNMEGVGKIIADEMKANLAGTDITISAKMGPITVQLTDGGGALQKMEKGFVGKMQEVIGTAINGLFNTDGSTKSKSTSPGMLDNLPR